MRSRTAALAILPILALGLAFPDGAEAQRRSGRHISGVRFDAHLDLGWHSSFGLGFRVDVPIVPDGLVDGVDDELAISPGAELFFWRYGRYGWRQHGDSDFNLWPLVALQWNFYINELWSVFPELGLAMVFWFADEYCHDHGGNYHCHGGTDIGFWPFIGVGARYHFNDRNALLMRINWPAGFQIGITF